MKIAIFIPYFTPPGGGVPNYFEYWQKSAAANERIDFYIPTNVDDSMYTPYSNIHFISMTADEFLDKVQSLLDFQIVRDYYKIGEYRPLCGLLFKDILADYDYWGQSEFDLIYGDILKFIQQYLDRGDEVIGRLGHFRIIKNTDKLRLLPYENAQQIRNPLNMEQAFSTKYCCYWDEIVGMGLRYYQAGVDVVSLNPVLADIDQKFKYFSVLGKTGKWGFSWRDGKLIGYSDLHENKEFMYAHFQKRKLSVISGDIPDSHFCVVPNRILNGCEYSSEINPGTILYTIKNRLTYYKKRNKEQRNCDTQLKMARKETRQYCVEHGLIQKS